VSTLPISIPLDRVAEFCQRSSIARLSLFGSVLRDDFTPQSDVDVLVEFEPGSRVGYFLLQDIEDGLSELFGRRVDLNTPASLSKSFRDEVLREARSLYVAA
jgi:predicted nucleotidyltransferase